MTPANGDPGSERWSRELAHRVAASASIVEARGQPARLLIGDVGGTVRALDVETGREAWTYDTREAVRTPPTWLAAQGRVLIALPSGRLVALEDTDGRYLWETSLGERIVAAPAVSDDGSVLIATHAGRMHVVDAQSGRRIEAWNIPGAAWHPPIAIEGDAIAIATQNVRESLVLYEEGRVGVRIDIGLERVASAAPAVTADGNLVYAVSGEPHGVVQVYDRRGDRIAEFRTPAGTPLGVSLTGTGTNAWIVGRTPHGGTWLQHTRLDANGNEASTSTVLAKGTEPAGPVAVGLDDTAWVALSDGTVIAQRPPQSTNGKPGRIDDANAIEWTARPEPQGATARRAFAPVAGHGAVFVTDALGRIRAIEAGGAAGPRDGDATVRPSARTDERYGCRPSHYEWLGGGEPHEELMLGDPGLRLRPPVTAPATVRVSAVESAPTSHAAWPTPGQNSQRTARRSGAYCLPGELLARLPRGPQWTLRIEPAGAGASADTAASMKGTIRSDNNARDDVGQKVAVAAARGRYHVIVAQKSEDERGKEIEADTVLRATFLVRDTPRQRLALGDEVPVPRKANANNWTHGPSVTPSGAPWMGTLRGRHCGASQEVDAKEAPQGLVWMADRQTLYAAVPGEWRITWTSDACTPFATRVKVEWPRDPDRIQTHVAHAPADLIGGQVGTGTKVFKWELEPEKPGWERVPDGSFARDNRGRTVLAWVDAGDAPGQGTKLHLMAVQTVHEQEAMLGVGDAVVGRQIEYWKDFATKLGETQTQSEEKETGGTAEADVQVCGTPPSVYVVDDLAAVNTNPGYYNRASRSGPVFPVNATGPITLAFYRTQSTWFEAGAGARASVWTGWRDETRFFGAGNERRSAAAGPSPQPWPFAVARYDVRWPDEAGRIVIANPRGLELAPQERTATVYRQPDPKEPGYNPNDEHAWVDKGILWAARWTRRGESEPWVLLQIRSGGTCPQAQMRAIAVVVVDPPEHTLTFNAEAGQLLRPSGAMNHLAESGHAVSQRALDPTLVFRSGENVYARRARNRGKAPLQVTTRLCYEPKNTFDTPADAAECPWQDSDGRKQLAWLVDYARTQRTASGENAPPNTPVDVHYNVVWGNGVPVLYPEQIVAVTPPKSSVPSVHDAKRIEILYDQASALGKGPAVRILNVAGERAVEYGSNSIRETFEWPQSVEVPDGGRDIVVFPELAPHLRHQLYARSDTKRGMLLALRGGYLDMQGNIAVEAEPSYPFVLMNVLSERDHKAILRVLGKGKGKGKATFRDAVERLAREAATPLEPSTEPPEHPGLTAVGPSGFVTYAVTTAKGPMEVRVLRVAEKPPCGDVIVSYHDNPFAEEVYVRHSNDFGGKPERFVFRWQMRLNVTDGKDEPRWTDLVVPENGRGRDALLLTGREQLASSKIRARFRPAADPDGWSEWTDPPREVRGWMERVSNGINVFDGRATGGDVLNKLRLGEVSTDVNIVEQAGPRYRAAAPLGGERLDQFGMIEIYETVYRRGRALSLDAAPPDRSLNADLQRFAGRISDLYVILGNEAYADAGDPTIIIPSENGQSVGAENTEHHPFAGLTDSLLAEELALLRGRAGPNAQLRAGPVYNRLPWNVTGNVSSALYVNNYGISSTSGKKTKIDEARRLYPQGHGDAYGHYLMALKVYHTLLQNPDFIWTRGRSEEDFGGTTVTVDFFDERKVAQAALGRALAGLAIVDLSHRRAYARNGATLDSSPVPAPEQEEARGKVLKEALDQEEALAWTATDWGTRTGQGAYLDWVLVNALMPEQAEIDDDLLGPLERSAVPELEQLAGTARKVQDRVDVVVEGLNPLGIPESYVPFDVGADQQIRNRTTAFPILLQRALDALAELSTTHRSMVIGKKGLRDNVAKAEQIRKEVDDRNASFKDRAIALFGTPFKSNKGPGKRYGRQYDGPDLDYFTCIEGSEFIRNLGIEAGPNGAATFEVRLQGIDAEAAVERLEQPQTAEDALKAEGHGMRFTLTDDAWAGCVRPEGDRRGEEGEIQAGIRAVLFAAGALDDAARQYGNIVNRIREQIETLELLDRTAAGEWQLTKNEQRDMRRLNEAYREAQRGRSTAHRAAAMARIAASTAASFVPMSLGWSSADLLSGVRGALRAAGDVIAEAYMVEGEALEDEALGYTHEREIVGAKAAAERLVGQQQLQRKRTVNDVKGYLSQERGARAEVYRRYEHLRDALRRYQSTVGRAQRLIEDWKRLTQRVGGRVRNLRYRDMALRFLRREGVERYRDAFDEALRAAALVARQFEFEVNAALGDRRAEAFVNRVVAERAIGYFREGRTSSVAGGLSGILHELNKAYTNLNNGTPSPYISKASIRKGLFGIPRKQVGGNTVRVPHQDVWRERLRANIVTSLELRPELKGCCKDLKDDEPALVIPFSTMFPAVPGFYNQFGNLKEEVGFNDANFRPVIQRIAVELVNYPQNSLEDDPGYGRLVSDPKVYLVAVGLDFFRVRPRGGEAPAQVRAWNLARPVGFQTERQPAWLSRPHAEPFFGTLPEFTDKTGPGGLNWTQQHFGRSIYNSQWYLVIPLEVLNPSDSDRSAELLLGSADGYSGLTDIIIVFDITAWAGASEVR